MNKKSRFAIFIFLIVVLIFISFIYFVILENNKAKINKFNEQYPFLSSFIDDFNKSLMSKDYNKGMIKYFKLMFGKGKIKKILVDKYSNKFFSYFLLKGILNSKSVNFFIKGINVSNKIIFFDNNIYPVSKNVKTIKHAINNLIALNDNEYSVKIEKNTINVILNDFNKYKITINQNIKIKKGEQVKNILFYISEFYKINYIKIGNKNINYKILELFSDDRLFKKNVNIYQINTINEKNIINLNISYQFIFNRLKAVKNPILFCKIDNDNLKYFSISSIYSQNTFNLLPFNNFICNNSKLELTFINNTKNIIYSNLNNNITENVYLSNISLFFSKTSPIKIKINDVEYNFFVDKDIFPENYFKIFLKKLKNVISKMNIQLLDVIGIDFSKLSKNYFIIETNYPSSSFCEPLNIIINFNIDKNNIYNSFDNIFLTIFHELLHYFSGYKITFSKYNENYIILNETLTQFFEYSNLTYNNVRYYIEMFNKLLINKYNLNNLDKLKNIIKFNIKLCLNELSKINKYKEIPVLFTIDNQTLNLYKYDIAILYFYYLFYLCKKENMKKIFFKLIQTNPSPLYFERYLDIIKQSVSEEKYKIIENFIYDTLFTDKIDFEKYGKIEDVAEYMENIFKKSILDGL